MTFVQVKASTLLIGEEGLDGKAFFIPSTGLSGILDVGDQIDGFFVFLVPPDNGMHRPIALLGKQDFRQTFASAWFDLHGFKRKGLLFICKLNVLGRATDILPPRGVQLCLQTGPIELSVPQKHDGGGLGDQGLDLADEGQMVLFRKVTFAAFDHHPAKRQRPILIHHVEHQRGTASAHGTAVHHQHQRQVGKAMDEGLSIRQKIGLNADPIVVDPPRKAFDTAFGKGAVEYLFRDLGKWVRWLPTMPQIRAAKVVRCRARLPLGCSGYNFQRVL